MSAREEAWIAFSDGERAPTDGVTYTRLRNTFYAAYAAGLERAAQIAEGKRPETGLHINVSEYRQGKADAVALIAAAIRSEVGQP